MDLIQTEILGLVAHSARTIAHADWSIVATMDDQEAWRLDWSHVGERGSEKVRMLWDAARVGGASHPDVLFTSHACMLIQDSSRRWICVGWDDLRPDQVTLSAGQMRILEALETCLTLDSNGSETSIRSKDKIGASLLAHSRDSAAVLDVEGSVQAISPSLADRFGWPPKRLLQQPIPVIWPGGSTRRNALLAAASRGSVIEAEVSLVRKSGEPESVPVRLSNFGDESYPRILLTLIN